MLIMYENLCFVLILPLLPCYSFSTLGILYADILRSKRSEESLSNRAKELCKKKKRERGIDKRKRDIEIREEYSGRYSD